MEKQKRKKVSSSVELAARIDGQAQQNGLASRDFGAALVLLAVQMRQHLKWAAITFGNRASGRKCVEQKEVMHTRGLLPITYYRLRLEWAFKDRLKLNLSKGENDHAKKKEKCTK